MSETTAAWDYYSSWNDQFYYHYLQQHARMTHWLQNIHHSMQNTLDQTHARTSYWIQNLHQNPYHSLDHQNHASYSYDHHQNWQQPVLQQRSYISHERRSCRHRGNSRRNSRHQYRRRPETHHVHSTNMNEIDVKGEENDDDDELVLNEDPILAFRALKADSVKAESEESFELVEAIVDENFEFVQLDNAGVLQKLQGKPTAPDTRGDIEYDRDSRIVLFGDNADRIAGLETSLEITFDHLNDIYQPVVFPRV